MRPIKQPTANTYGGLITLKVKAANPLYKLYYALSVLPSSAGSNVIFVSSVTGVGGVTVTMALASYTAGLKVVLEASLVGSTVCGVTPAKADAAKDQFLKAGGGFAITNVYSLARLDLISQLGQFCSFCEMPVGDSGLAIEHVIPKSMFLAKSCDFANFLLACPMCNSFKWNHPTSTSYFWPMAWANPAIANKGAPSYKPASWKDYDNTGSVLFNAYMWPTYKGVYHNVRRALDYQSPPSGPFTSSTSGLQSTDRITAIVGGVVEAQLQGPPTGIYNVQVTVTGIGGAIASTSVPFTAPTTPNPVFGANPNAAALTNKWDRTTGQGLVNLNNSSDSQSFSDRRMFNRTRACFTALAAFNRLNTALEIPVSPPAAPTAVYSLLMGEVISTAGATGFFSTWVAVFDSFDRATAGSPYPTTVGTTFGTSGTATVDLIMGMTVNAAPGIGFPGTNIDNTVP